MSKVHGPQSTVHGYKRILVVRLDRIGDVVLSTPVLKNLRNYFPGSHIAFMVRPCAKDIVYGNPYINEVIVYDKKGGLINTLEFALKIRKNRFDLAVILHPTSRTHLIAFFAGIPERVGYDRKWGWLLTRRIPHTKQFGLKHERDYTLDVLRYICHPRPLSVIPAPCLSFPRKRESLCRGQAPAGIFHQGAGSSGNPDSSPRKRGLRHSGMTSNRLSKDLHVPISAASEEKIEKILTDNGIREDDLVIAVNPGASCPSKRWPAKRFAEVCDRISQKFKAKIVIISGEEDISHAEALERAMKSASYNLAGKTSISDLASLLKRSRLFISNDSGPVHIASAVGTPVISIFGRLDRGLSPMRWRPCGKLDIALHKDAGCLVCRSHDCENGFKCLEAITANEVIEAAERIIDASRVSC